ncbi:hypothetical protein VLK31_27460 [Variovorax sp. H27-G14]|uniref:hypothetical protein n=1 Tax=Variovorax sp. H27-G14 TaxID=3111914 RepID=UPI0038FC66A9
MANGGAEKWPKDYPDWQAAKIRARLQEYRDDNAIKARTLPISQLIYKIQECPALLPEMFIENGEKLEMDDEWLRRFTKGQSGLEFLRVEALKIFLVHENYFAAEELEDDSGDFGELYSMFGFMGRADSAALNRAASMAATYLNESDLARGKPSAIILQLEPHRIDGLFYAKEIFSDVGEQKLIALRTQASRNRYSAVGRIRKGFAFFSTKANALHVFLRGAVPSDRIHVIEAGKYDNKAIIELYRFGGVLEVPPSAIERFPSVGPLKFVPTGESSSKIPLHKENPYAKEAAEKMQRARLNKLH